MAEPSDDCNVETIDITVFKIVYITDQNEM